MIHRLLKMKRTKPDTWELVFDQAEAKGTIELVAGAYGLSVKIDGRPACLIDLHPTATDTGAPQVVIDDAGGADTLAVAVVFQKQTQLYLNSDVNVVGHSHRYGNIYGRKQ